MILLLFGPPGSGKGTQSQRITRWLGIPGISTGDLLRSEVQSQSELGQMAEAILKHGGLVSDDLVNQMVAERIKRADCKNGFLLDGYPRTVAQAGFLARELSRLGLDQPIVLHLEVPFGVIKRRIGARRTCPKCGTVYNLLNDPPKTRGRCNLDGRTLVRRADDDPATFEQRLVGYDNWTKPVLKHYQYGKYSKINGNRPPDEVFADVEALLAPLLAKPEITANSSGPRLGTGT